MKFPTATLAVFVAASTASLAWAQSPDTSGGSGAVPADTLKAITLAVGKADLDALDQLGQSSSDAATRWVIVMAQERIHGDFDKSSADASSCEHQYVDSAVETALYCARFRVGNLRLAGHEAEAEKADLEMVKRFQSKLPDAQAHNLEHYASSNDGLPPLTVQRPAAGFSVPLLYAEKRRRDGGIWESSKRDIAVSANGHAINMRFGSSAANMMLDEDTAKALGVRIVDTQVTVKSAASDTKIGAQWGILDKLTFDGVTVENAPVLIVPRTVPTIGIDIFKYLGAFRITKDAIVVYGPDDQRPANSDPILIASYIDGTNMRLVASLSINGENHLTLINTANPYYLTGSKGAMDDVDTRFAGQIQRRDVGNVTHGEVVDRTVATVVIGGQSIQMKFGVFPDENLRWNYQLGRSALQDMDIYVDFQNRRLAFIPRNDMR